MKTRRFGPVASAVLVLAAGAAGIIAALIYNGTQDSGMVVGSGEGTEAAAVAPLVGGNGASDSAAGSGVVSPAAEATPTEDLPAPFDFSDEEVAAAIAEAEANPIEVALPGRDSIATERLIAELEGAGHDLTGIDVVVYPAGSAPSFVLLTATDAAALFALDASSEAASSEAFDAFINQLIGSPVFAEFGVENFVLEYSGVDEQGPLVATMIVGIDALRSAVSSGADISTELALQVERP